jgi:hypothetical protein
MFGYPLLCWSIKTPIGGKTTVNISFIKFLVEYTNNGLYIHAIGFIIFDTG